MGRAPEGGGGSGVGGRRGRRGESLMLLRFLPSCVFSGLETVPTVGEDGRQPLEIVYDYFLP